MEVDESISDNCDVTIDDAETLAPALKRLRLHHGPHTDSSDEGADEAVPVPVGSPEASPDAKYEATCQEANMGTKVWDRSTGRWRRRRARPYEEEGSETESEDNDSSDVSTTLSPPPVDGMTSAVENIIRRSLTDSAYNELSESKKWQIVVFDCSKVKDESESATPCVLPYSVEERQSSDEDNEGGASSVNSEMETDVSML